jgi:alpha-galactosidase
MTFSAKNLPSGLKLDSKTGIITSFLKTIGDYKVLVSASNALGVAERELKIVVGNQLCLSPPMGWCSWNAWLKKVDQKKMEEAAEYLVRTGLKDHGFLFVNIDDGWQGVRSGKDNALQANEKFPNMKGLCDKIHALGLKAGIYHTPWMTSFGTLPGGTASSPDGNWNVSDRTYKIGSYSFLNQDAKLWSEWGFDYCKWDWFPHEIKDIISVAGALRLTGRDMICSVSNRAVFEHLPTYMKYTNLWRTTNDFLGHWEHLQTIGFAQDRWAEFGGPGHWLDMDQLVLGYAWGGQSCNLTPDEQYLETSMWCLMSAPILISFEFEKIDQFTLRLLSNDEVLDIDQDPLGKPARRVLARGPLDVWLKDLEDGSKAIGFFNRSREAMKETINLNEIGLSSKYLFRDLWKRADLGVVSGSITVEPSPHGVKFYKITKVN